MPCSMTKTLAAPRKREHVFAGVFPRPSALRASVSSASRAASTSATFGSFSFTGVLAGFSFNRLRTHGINERGDYYGVCNEFVG